MSVEELKREDMKAKANYEKGLAWADEILKGVKTCDELVNMHYKELLEDENYEKADTFVERHSHLLNGDS